MNTPENNSDEPKNNADQGVSDEDLEVATEEEPAAEVIVGHPGYLVREARKQQEIKLADVASELGMTEGSVRDLEEEHFDRFAGEIYVRGYLRNYARFVGVDDSRVQQAYDLFQENLETEARKEGGKSSVIKLSRRNTRIKESGQPKSKSGKIARWTVYLFVTGLLLVAFMIGAALLAPLLGSA